MLLYLEHFSRQKSSHKVVFIRMEQLVCMVSMSLVRLKKGVGCMRGLCHPFHKRECSEMNVWEILEHHQATWPIARFEGLLLLSLGAKVLEC